MRKVSESALKKAIIASEAERSKQQLIFSPDGGKLTRIRQSTDRITQQWLKSSGLEMNKVQALQKQRDLELDRLVAKHKTDALRRAARLKKRLHPDIALQSKHLAELAALDGFFPHPSFNLDTAFLIWSTPLLDLESSAAPFDNWARFKFKTSGGGKRQKVSFYFYWSNPFSDFAVINATTFLSSIGHLRSHASWGGTVNSAEILAFALFGIWFGVQNDLNATGYTGEFLGRAGSLSTPFIGSDTTGTSISAGSSLNKLMFAVPAGTVAVFEVALFLEYEIDSGDVEADFESGDFRIACPVVVFSLLNSPPPL